MATKVAKNGPVGVNRVAGAAVPEGPAAILIPQLDVRVAHVPIEGITPLIMHKWSEKAVAMMLEKQQKKAKAPKEAKDPEECFRQATYTVTGGGYGFPAVGFKAAMVGACRRVPGLSMTLAKTVFFVRSDSVGTGGEHLVRIKGPEPVMRRDMVRLESGVADIRFRPEFRDWSADLQVEYDASMVSEEQVVQLVELAGTWGGIGEWRPSAPKCATGSYGRFCVKRG
jgi:hypothetical protein